MTVLELRCSSAWVILTAPLLLMITLQLYLIISAFGNRRSRKIRILYILHFLVSFAFMFIFFYQDSSWTAYREFELPFSGLYRLLEGFPVLAVLIYYAVTVPVIVMGICDIIRYRRTHLTSESIKETMDLLPVGVAFTDTDGTAAFSNMTINSLSRSLTGKVFTGMDTFMKGVREHSTSDHSGIITMPDGTGVWQMEERRVTASGEDYIQLTATDISRQAVFTKELERKNKKLRDIQMRLTMYNKTADRMVISRELLTARMAVHNELGNVLLESRHYLNDPESFDEEVLLAALKNTNTYLLREYEEDDTERDSLTDAMEMAGTIGVDVHITGIIPSEDPARSILAAAIIECATNTVKHAEGDEIHIGISSRSTGSVASTVISIRNNGIQPTEKVRESGGLLSLRALVEKESGSMRICSSPDLELTITLPEK